MHLADYTGPINTNLSSFQNFFIRFKHQLSFKSVKNGTEAKYEDGNNTSIAMYWNKCLRCHDSNQRHNESHEGVTDRKHRLYFLAVYGTSTNWNRSGSSRRTTEDFHEHASRCGQP